MPASPLCEPESTILFLGVARDQLPATTESGVRDAVLFNGLSEIQSTRQACILAVQTDGLETMSPVGSNQWHVAYVPPHAILNAEPFLDCREVAAAGGLVLRTGSPTAELLLIFRNGLWDLPKGKQSGNETLDVCAQREVLEETGIERLQIGPYIAATRHGYKRDGEYHIKTSHWFAFEGCSSSFMPQMDEGITRVAWMPWEDAQRCIGFATLRDLLRRAYPVMESQIRRAADRNHV